ncbi:hypothetical protein KZZ52_28695 [Dactylosporangium sp. AC04546]|uniref:hypothetical protein n=1 Tax=Dactylosporangium sp. AC04546 TaxID=2862460 RepID=UPI001EDFE592|nr:hypothetical protein [Dactylosporangium sp. AC04546]WVK89249.1 hypothetical protein KZZ52_28695 [Dactylosporangium sp. AC04546]
MTFRAVAMFALATTVLAGTSACLGFDAGGEQSTPFTASQAPPSPTGTPAKDDFVAALRRVHAASYRFAVDSPLPEGGTVKAAGAFDPVGKLFEATTTITGAGQSQDGTHHRIVIAKDSYQREETGKRWIHLDLSRIAEDNPLLYFDTADPTGLAKFTANVKSVERTSDTTYTGTVDPYVKGPGFLPIGAPSIVTLGMGRTPFKATADAQGNILTITIELSPTDKPKISMTTTLSEHGKPLTTKPPKQSLVDEADEMYYK